MRRGVFLFRRRIRPARYIGPAVIHAGQDTVHLVTPVVMVINHKQRAIGRIKA